MRRTALAATLLLALVACHKAGTPTASPSTGTRRTTTAKVRIVAPRAGETVGRTVTIRIAVDGAPVLDPNDVTATTGGHVHIYVDGKLYYMTKDLVQTVKLAPGSHNLRADFVAPDHQPFLDPVSATVVFTVKA
jgi:hypothetical protein